MLSGWPSDGRGLFVAMYVTFKLHLHCHHLAYQQHHATARPWPIVVLIGIAGTIPAAHALGSSSKLDGAASAAHYGKRLLQSTLDECSAIQVHALLPDADASPRLHISSRGMQHHACRHGTACNRGCHSLQQPPISLQLQYRCSTVPALQSQIFRTHTASQPSKHIPADVLST